MRALPLDQEDRTLAVTTFDRNVVVTAGAGTGKTTLLVMRMIHLLMREPHPLKVPEIVALTFTNKAADEMKQRLRNSLATYFDSDGDLELAAELMDRYKISKSVIEIRAKEALRQMERSEIGTIHHFAATLLRLYPIEAGVDPHFQVGDEKTDFTLFFKEKWSAWLEAELSENGVQKTRWRRVLKEVALEEIERLAFLLAREAVPLDEIGKINDETASLFRLWLEQCLENAEDLLARHPENRKIEKAVALAGKLFGAYLSSGAISSDLRAAWERELGSKEPGKPKGWEQADAEQAKRLFKIARRLLSIAPKTTGTFVTLLKPFLASFQEEYLKSGFISYNTLLLKTRDLLRDHGLIRAETKRRYKAILVDEFQDTDPVQYEILLYLSESPELCAFAWRDVRLAPGKLFVVGDPKQSIYGFRQADIGACETVKKMILQQGGLHCTLRTNFRSDAAVLDVVNGLFEAIIHPEEGIQPEYIAIHPPSEILRTSDEKKDALYFPEVSLRIVQCKEGVFDADSAREAEGEALAKWLSEEVIGRRLIHDKEGQLVEIQRKDIAILMRSLSKVHDYLEPLRRWGIRYVVEGERRLYANQEVIDAVNLLRVVADPNDRLALVGLLRSSVGGFSDAEIYAFHQRNHLDYRMLVQDADIQGIHPRLEVLYLLLHRLHTEAQKLSVAAAVEKIFHETPILLLATHMTHGEQALANLEKIQREAMLLGEGLEGRFSNVVAILAKRVLEGEEGEEAALAEEDIDALRIYTIHKAKGLEFPMVIIAGAQTEGRKTSGDQIELWHEGFGHFAGLHVGEHWELPAIYLADKSARRELEEEKRVLYVAMTRACEYLVFSAASVKKGGSGGILRLLEEGIESLDLAGESGMVPVGKGSISKRVIQAEPGEQKMSLSNRPPKPRADWKFLEALWKARHKAYDAILKRPLFMSPSSLKESEEGTHSPVFAAEQNSHSGEVGRLIGQLAHRFLEVWDFSNKVESLQAVLSDFLSEQVIPDVGVDSNTLKKELEEIFQIFFASAAYQEICQSKIVGREVPFLLSWEGRIMEGFIDLIYEREGTLIVVEYKTDRVTREHLSAAAEKYRHQCRIYPEAVRRTLKREVAEMKLLFLRIGESVSGDQPVEA